MNQRLSQLWQRDATKTVLASLVSILIGMAVGVVLAAVFGFFAIKLMLRVIRKANYVWFSVYLTALSVVCFSLCAAGVLPL